MWWRRVAVVVVAQWWLFKWWLFGGGGCCSCDVRQCDRQARRGREEAKKALDEKLRERDMLNKQARCAEIGEIRRD